MGRANIKPPVPLTPPTTMRASDLERIVIISGPQSALPTPCQQHIIDSGLLYRPVVDTHEGVERLYAKYNLPLFEIIDENSSKADDLSTQNDKERAGPVLRRRHKQSTHANGLGVKIYGKHAVGESTLEDISTEHYQKLHRKPEYIEKRVRNREIELYQYARWQDGQRKESERRRQQLSRYNQGYVHHTGDGAAGSEAGTQASSQCASPLHMSHVESSKDKPSVNTIGGLDAHDTNDVGHRVRKRAKPAVGMRKDIVAPRAKNSPRTRAASPAPSSRSNSQCSVGADIGAGHLAELRLSDEGTTKEGDSSAGLQTILTEAERKTAHLAGNILEQFMVQAARLPMQTMPESPAPSVRSASPDESASASEDESEDGGSGDESKDAESEDQSDASDESVDESVDEPVDCTGCRSCCPREFALPPRLTDYILKQRKTQAKENECKRKAKK
ncbi:hypothetical protein IW148_001058 [Coemansia sp. RSA 1199]|nr:hypothetical protein IW148_001058 [Coemansia sp. RSA 1199]